MPSAAPASKSDPADIPSVPVAPGPRASALQKIFNEALSHTLRNVSYANFAACFPTPAKYCPESLNALWKQMVDKFEALAKSEFDDILRERDVVPSLNELDKLVVQAQRRKADAPEGADVPTPPHLLPPSAILAAHLRPYLIQQQSQLNAKIQTTQLQNVQLAETIQSQRQEIKLLLVGLENVINDLEGAVKVVEGSVRDGRIEAEVDGIEGDLKTVSS